MGLISPFEINSTGLFHMQCEDVALWAPELDPVFVIQSRKKTLVIYKQYMIKFPLIKDIFLLKNDMEEILFCREAVKVLQ